LVVNALNALEKVPEIITGINIANNIALYELLNDYSLEALIALMAFSLEKQNSRKVLYYLGKLRNIKPAITGDDLIKAGINPGPRFRHIFKKILELKLQGNNLDKERELEIAKQHQNI
jgi:tRNA nucleotidyltransferase (CCA-adding enzyme)